MKPTIGSIQMAVHGIMKVDTGVTEPVTVQYRNCTVQIQFHILNLVDHKIYIGVRHLTILGIGITGLETKFPDEMKRPEDPIIEDIVLADNKLLSKDQQQEFDKTVKETLKGIKAFWPPNTVRYWSQSLTLRHLQGNGFTHPNIKLQRDSKTGSQNRYSSG